MSAFICIALGVIALYCLGMWLFLAVGTYRLLAALRKAGLPLDNHRTRLDAIARNTFHLGLCGILALGFLGLIL